jgi:MFS family permease
MFFIVFGIFFILFYLPSYGSIHGFSSSMIFYSVSVLNAASFFGRILPGMLADTWGPYNIMIVTAIMCSVLTFASIAAKDTASILVVGALYGFASGNVLSLQGACIPPLLDNPSKIGVAIGQMLSVSGVGALLGPPICGWLIAAHGFSGAQIFSGVMMAVGSGLLIVTRSFLAKPGSKLII